MSTSEDAQRRAWLAGLALAVAGAVFFSAKAVIAKLLYREGIDAVTLIALRMLLSLPVFLAVAVWTWRRQPRLDARDLGRIALLGLLGYYLSSMLDFLGLQYVSAGLERLILFLTPSFVLLIGLFVLGRSVTRRQWWSLGFAYAGIVLVFWHDVNLGGPQVALGSALVAGAAISYAIYLLLSGELIARVGSLRLVALAMTVSTAACLLQYALLRPLPGLIEQTLPVWRLSLLNASLCTVLPVFLTMISVGRIGAGPSAQAGMIGPVSTLFLAWWLLGEPITALQLAGTGLVMTGMLLLSLRQARR
ncbi:DMT family transporter [Solimonas sp. SE-A11]|uniref:DMT family transporter n=1 Tax=Solimonas sp. SE-A11 TaxID=3054954 RepID=UPI00259D2E26|nr:DMT family transporter [Solimonas sp. SE-A11]MDM4769790.1 DMT family transporter [Solimonas sp. SE-A11]